MANLSDVSGEIIITANTPKTIELLNEIFKADDGEYFTNVGEGIENIEKRDDGKYEGETDFVGVGRWCYSNNIESFL